MAPRSIEALEEIVLRFLAKLGMADLEYIDLEAVLQAMVSLFPGFSYDTIPDDQLRGAGGMYDSRTDKMQIPNSIFWGMRNRIPYCRFSVAHEIAHVVLGHDGIRFRHVEKRAYEKANPDIRRDEREAEQFAAILLAPTHLAKKCKTIEELKERFGLSDRAAEIRGKEIEARLRREKGEKQALPQKVVDFLRYAESKGYRTSKVKVDLDSALRYREAVAKDRECAKSAEPSAARLVTSSPAFGSSTAPKTQFLQEICNVCRQPKVFPLGAKSKCDNCGTVFDRFQDGDP